MTLKFEFLASRTLLLTSLIVFASSLSTAYQTPIFYLISLFLGILCILLPGLRRYLLIMPIASVLLFSLSISSVYLASFSFSDFFDFLLGSGPGFFFVFILSLLYFNQLDSPSVASQTRLFSPSYFPSLFAVLSSTITLFNFRINPDLILLHGSRLLLSADSGSLDFAYQRISYNYLILLLLTLYLLMPYSISITRMPGYLIRSCLLAHRASLPLYLSAITFSLFATAKAIPFFLLIGSNSGIYFVGIVLASLLYMLFSCFIAIYYLLRIPILSPRYLLPLAIFVLTLSLLIVFSSTLDFASLSTFKLFNEDGLNLNSLASRQKINSSFIEHLRYNNFVLGGFNVEDYTTGTGTYSHSFFLSLLSHGGLPSFICLLPLAYYFLTSSVLIICRYRFLIPSLLILSSIFFFSNIATFFTWRPLFLAVLLHFTLIRHYALDSSRLRCFNNTPA